VDAENNVHVDGNARRGLTWLIKLPASDMNYCPCPNCRIMKSDPTTEVKRDANRRLAGARGYATGGCPECGQKAPGHRILCSIGIKRAKNFQAQLEKKDTESYAGWLDKT
jgi:hypothetical protein